MNFFFFLEQSNVCDCPTVNVFDVYSNWVLKEMESFAAVSVAEKKKVKGKTMEDEDT